MKKITVKIDWLFNVGNVRAVEKHLSTHPGITGVEINPVSGIAIISYDETRISIDNIKELVRTCGYHCQVFQGHDNGAWGRK